MMTTPEAGADTHRHRLQWKSTPCRPQRDNPVTKETTPMLVSYNHRFIFLKTKKTAGTSIELYFEPFCMPPEVPGRKRAGAQVSEYGVVGSRGKQHGGSRDWRAHMSAQQILDKIGDETWHGYLRFATIRNPYDKAVSAYFFKKHRRREPIIDPAHERDAFQVWLESEGPPMDRNKFMIEGEYCLSDVIRYESMLSDLERICMRVGVPFEPDRLPQAKSGVRPPWATVPAMYSDPARVIVAELFALEIELFGYAFPDDLTADRQP